MEPSPDGRRLKRYGACYLKPWLKIPFGNKTDGVRVVRNNQESMPLREQAMEALQESTSMLKVANNLLEQGNNEEAERLHHVARNKRNVSVLLMAKANALEHRVQEEGRASPWQ